MAFIPDRPMHNRFIFRELNNTDYRHYALQYSRAKSGGIRGIYLYLSGAGIQSLVIDIGKGFIINSGKRKLGIVVLCAISYVTGPTLMVFTNATKVVKIAKNVHVIASYCWETSEDLSNISFLPIDMILFGQPIPLGATNRFNLLNMTNF